MTPTALLLASVLVLATAARAQNTPPPNPADAPNPGPSSASKAQSAKETAHVRHAQAARPSAQDEAQPQASSVSSGAQKTYRERKKPDVGTACSSARMTPAGKLDCGMSGKSATAHPGRR